MSPDYKSTWTKVLNEIKGQRPGVPIDLVRRKKLDDVFKISERPIIIYATACTVPNKILHPLILQINPSDNHSIAQIIEKIEGPNLDILLHSPGGSAEATESIVTTLRNKFQNIRFIIPSYAKSAATMLALSGDEIIMDQNAELGPIDPQMITRRAVSPAQAILDQFDKANKQIEEDRTRTLSWAPILEQLGPSLLVQSENAIKLSKEMVKDWLKNYMFKNDSNPNNKAQIVVDFLSDHNYFKSHGRRVGIEDLQAKGVKVKNLKEDPRFQKAILELFCSLDLSFSNTAIVRLIENHYGDAVMRFFTPG